MPKKVTIDKPLNFDADWGGVYKGGTQPFPEIELKNNQEWGYARGRVEKAIKDRIKEVSQGNFGAVYVETTPDLLATIRFFENKDKVNEWKRTGDQTLVLDQFQIQQSSTPQIYVLDIDFERKPSLVQSIGGSNDFIFTYYSLWGGSQGDADDGPGTIELLVNGEKVWEDTKVMSGTKCTVPIGEYCVVRENNVVVNVSNRDATRSFPFTITAIDLSLTFSDNYIDNQYLAKIKPWEKAWNLILNLKGTPSNVYIKLDNSIYDLGVNSAGTIVFPIETSTLGLHTIEAWAHNEEYDLRSDTLKGQIIVDDDSGSSGLVVAIGANPPASADLWGEITIPYFFHYPSKAAGTDVEVTMKLYGDGIEESLPTQVVTMQNGGSSGMCNATIGLMNADYKNKTLHVDITVDGVTAQHYFTVVESNVTLMETKGYTVYYDLTKRNNNETDVANNNISCNYNGVESHLVRSANFKLGDEYGFHGGCVIPANSTLVLTGWQPFAVDHSANGSGEEGKLGLSIEMELEVGICSNQDIPVVDCLGSQRCGFRVYPNRVEVVYGGSNSIITYFPEGERVKFSLVISKGTTEVDYFNYDQQRTEKKRFRLGYIYMNGVMVRVFDYEDNPWSQLTPQNIVFGSTEGSVTLYTLRGYVKEMMMTEVMHNYAYDTPVIKDKTDFANRNDLFLEGTEKISYTNIKRALPNTPVITWHMDALPTSKDDNKDIKETTFVNPEWVEGDGHSCAPFTAGRHKIKGDGTSSNRYPLPYKNWAEDFQGDDGITLHLQSDWRPEDLNEDENKNVHVTLYSITYGIEDAERKFVHKVNFASSEGIFNILAMNMYQKITDSVRNDVDDLLSKQQQEQVNRDRRLIYRKSLSGFPEIGLWKHPDEVDPNKTTTEFLSIYNFINNKKTGSMFGMTKDYTQNQLWEVDENINFFMTEMTEHRTQGNDVIYSNGVGSDNPFYYSRFPEKAPDGRELGIPTFGTVTNANDEIKALRHIHNWLWEVNPNVAERYKAQNGHYRTIAEGFEPVSYLSGYTEDSPAYRRLRFNHEYPDHLHLNDCIFYFLFCEWILGTDSMDKNMSLFLDDLKDFYDGKENAKVMLRIMLRDTDTTNMYDNTGKLTFKYWHEWGDYYDAGVTGKITNVNANGEPCITENGVLKKVNPVFNGRLSGLWDLISECIPESTINKVYKEMRSGGLNYADMFAQYKKFHDYWCEALYNVDGLGYINTGHLDKAHGDKFLLSKYFYKYRQRYMDSKYKYTDPNISATLRLYEAPGGGDNLGGVWMKYYSPMYASFSFGERNTINVRCIDGEKAYLPCPVTSFGQSSCYVNDPDMVTEMGFYAINGGTRTDYGLEGITQFYFQDNFSRFIRLKKFIWDNRTRGVENTMQGDPLQGRPLDFSSMKLLEELVMTNLTNYTWGIVIGSNIIKKIDFRGTPIASITIPETDTLTELHLPDSLISLTLKNVPNIARDSNDDFTIDGITNITDVHIENAGKADKYFAEALIAAVQANNTVNLRIGELSIPDDVLFNNDIFWKIYNAFYKNGTGFNPYVQDSEHPDRLFIQAKNGIYVNADKKNVSNGETVMLSAMQIPYSASAEFTYVMVGDGVQFNDETGIYTSPNGSTLNSSTGELTTAAAASDSVTIKAVSGSVESVPISIDSIKYKYPTGVSISGKNYLRRAGREYTYTASLSFGEDAGVIATSQTVEWSPVNMERAHITAQSSTECTVMVDNVDSADFPVTIKCKIIYSNGYFVENTKSINITNKVPEGAVDMGLPSETLWAVANIHVVSGSSSNFAEVNDEPSPFTYDCSYFTFGNTDAHNPDALGNFTAETDWEGFTLDQYFGNEERSIPQSEGAKLDGNIPLSHDAAHVHLGGDWRMPSQADFDELLSKCIFLEADGTERSNQALNTGQLIDYPIGNNEYIKGVYMKPDPVKLGLAENDPRRDSRLFIPACGRTFSNSPLKCTTATGAFLHTTISSEQDNSQQFNGTSTLTNVIYQQYQNKKWFGVPIRAIM